MFVAGDDYPSTKEFINSTAPAFMVAGEARLAACFEFVIRNSEFVINEQLYVVDEGKVIATVDDEIIGIELIVFDERYYVPSTPDDTRPGTFYYNAIAHTVTINSHAPLRGGQIYVSQLRITNYELRINCVAPPYSQILQEWNIQRYSINRALEDSPTASFTFNACRNKWDEVRSRFKPGRIVTLHDIPFRVTQLQIDKAGIHVYPNYYLEVQVSLEWALSETFNDSPLNKSVSGTSVTIGGNTLPSKPGTVTIGSNSVSGEVPIVSGGGSNNYSTVISALIDGAYAVGSFLYKSGDKVTTRRWGQTQTHLLNPLEIESEKLTYVLQNPNVSDVDDDNEDEEDLEEEEEEETIEEPPNPERDNEEIVEATRVEYENCDSDFDLMRQYYDDREAARSPTICFDTGGPTKVKRTITERGGVMLETVEVTYGYAFISKDVYAFQPDDLPPSYSYTGFLSNSWMKVSDTITTNYFDELGYLIKTEVKGYRLARFKQESDQLETSELYMAALEGGLGSDDASLLAEIDQYKFSQKLPIYDRTDYELESMMNYYPDIVRPSDDPSWIEPKFCSNMKRTQVDRILSPNPLTDEDGIVRPPILQVQELYEGTKTIITNTKCTPERFKVNQYSNSRQGEGGRDRIAITSSSENLGRPSTHTLVPITRIFWQDLVTPPSEEEDDKTKEEEKKKKREQITATSKTIDVARNETLSFSMKYKSNFNEGDKIYFEDRNWIVLDVSGEFVCEGPSAPLVGAACVPRENLIVRCESFNITLGKYVAIPINIDGIVGRITGKIS